MTEHVIRLPDVGEGVAEAEPAFGSALEGLASQRAGPLGRPPCWQSNHRPLPKRGSRVWLQGQMAGEQPRRQDHRAPGACFASEADYRLRCRTRSLEPSIRAPEEHIRPFPAAAEEPLDGE